MYYIYKKLGVLHIVKAYRPIHTRDYEEIYHVLEYPKELGYNLFYPIKVLPHGAIRGIPEINYPDTNISAYIFYKKRRGKPQRLYTEIPLSSRIRVMLGSSCYVRDDNVIVPSSVLNIWFNADTMIGKCYKGKDRIHQGIRDLMA